MDNQTLNQLSEREKRIDIYATHDQNQNDQYLQEHERNYQPFGNEPAFQSGQQIIDNHVNGMNRYMESSRRDIVEQQNPNAPAYIVNEIMENYIRSSSNDYDAGGVNSQSRNRTVARQEKYYFRSSERATAKATRYQNLSQNNKALREHAAAHDNRSASKRARKARNASRAYQKVAALQTSYKTDLESRGLSTGAQDQTTAQNQTMTRNMVVPEELQAQNLADYARLEEITRARIEALTLAAQVKSISKQQENYSIQKGKLKNLLVLRDSLTQLIEKNAGKQDEAALRTKLTALQDEIADTKNKVDRYVPQSGR